MGRGGESGGAGRCVCVCVCVCVCACACVSVCACLCVRVRVVVFGGCYDEAPCGLNLNTCLTSGGRPATSWPQLTPTHPSAHLHVPCSPAPRPQQGTVSTNYDYLGNADVERSCRRACACSTRKHYARRRGGERECVCGRARALAVLGDKVSGGHGRFNAFAVRPATDSAVDGINRTLLAAAAAAAAAAIAAGRFYEAVERVVGAPNCEWCLRRAGVVSHTEWYPGVRGNLTRLYASTIRGRQRQPKCVCCVCVRERESVCVCV